MNKLYWFLGGLILVVAILYFAIFSPKNDANTKKVATSIFAVHSLTEQIAKGGDIEVVNILPEGVSPHQYQPTAQDQLRLSSVDKVFVIGYELDNWAQSAAQSVNSNVKVVQMDTGLTLQSFEEEDDHDHEHEDDHDHEDDADHSDEEESHDHGEFDPHYWLSVKNAKMIAETIKGELVDLDADNAAVYEQNFTTLIEELDSLILNNAQIASKFKSKEIVTFHSAFGYFAKELGLSVVATVSEFPGQTPSPAYIANVGSIIREYGVKILFKEPELSEDIVAALANDYGATVETLDPLEGGQKGETYQSIIEKNIQVLARVLGQN